MEDTETTKKTKLFGLNSYEARIWTSLLSKGTSTAGELSDIANVPRSRSYDVLESLEKKGFVVLKPGKPIRYLTIPPKEVLERVKQKISKDTEKHILEMKGEGFNDLINTFQKLYDQNSNSPENMVVILKGRKNINKHLDFLFKGTKKEILFSIERETDKQPETSNKTGISTKSPNVGARVCVIDGENSIIFPTRKTQIHPDYDLGIWIMDNQISKFLKQLLTSA